MAENVSEDRPAAVTEPDTAVMTESGSEDRAAAGTDTDPQADAAESAGMERIKFFSDAVFAIAITLLILNIALPAATSDSNLAHRLGTIWPEYVAFAFTFLLIGLRWLTHLIQFRYIRRYDYPLLGLNLGLLSAVAFLPFASRVLADYPNSRAASVLYAGSMTVAGLISTLLWWHACWVGHLVDSPELDEYTRRNLLVRWGALPVFFSIAIILILFVQNLWFARGVGFAIPVVQIGIAARARQRGQEV
jgi:uncharacterized membrane protein